MRPGAIIEFVNRRCRTCPAMMTVRPDDPRTTCTRCRKCASELAYRERQAIKAGVLALTCQNAECGTELLRPSVSGLCGFCDPDFDLDAALAAEAAA